MRKVGRIDIYLISVMSEIYEKEPIIKMANPPVMPVGAALTITQIGSSVGKKANTWKQTKPN